MKKLIILILLLIPGFWTMACANSPDMPLATALRSVDGFRNAAWGMSKAEVKKQESNRMFSDDGSELLYQGKLSDQKCGIYYRFEQDQLVAGMYLISYTDMNKAQARSEFARLKDSLQHQYDRPTVLVNTGTVSWETKDSKIFLVLQSISEDFHLVKVVYRSKAEQYAFNQMGSRS